MKKLIQTILCAVLSVLLLLPSAIGVSALGDNEICVDGKIYNLTTDKLPAGLLWNAASGELPMEDFHGAYLETPTSMFQFNIILKGSNTLSGKDPVTGELHPAINAGDGMLYFYGDGSLSVTAQSSQSLSGISAYIVFFFGGHVDLDLTVAGSSSSASVTGLAAAAAMYNDSSLRIRVQNFSGGNAVCLAGDSFADSSTGLVYLDAFSTKAEAATALKASATFSSTGAFSSYSTGVCVTPVPSSVPASYKVSGKPDGTEYALFVSSDANRISRVEVDGSFPTLGGTFYQMANGSSFTVSDSRAKISTSATKWTYVEDGKTVTAAADSLVSAREYTLTLTLVPSGSAKFFHGAPVFIGGTMIPASDVTVTDSKVTAVLRYTPTPASIGFASEVPSVNRDNGIGYVVTPSFVGTPERAVVEILDTKTSKWSVIGTISDGSFTIDGEEKYYSSVRTFRVVAYAGREIAVGREFTVAWSVASLPITSLDLKAESPRAGLELPAPTVPSSSGCYVDGWKYYYDGNEFSGPAGPGCEYEAVITLIPNAGYIWSDKVSVRFNGAVVNPVNVTVSAEALFVRVSMSVPSVIPKFTSDPVGGSASNESSFTNVTYSTDIPFEELMLERFDGTKWVEVCPVTESVFDIPYSPVFSDSTVKFRLRGSYTNAGSTQFAYSQEFSVSWYTQKEKIISITATVPSPVGGAVPSSTIVSGDADKYTVSNLDWNGVTSFVSAGSYRVRFTVTPVLGYTVDMVALNSVRLNGVSCSYVSNSPDGKGYVFECTLTASYPEVTISRISISGITAPIEGKTGSVAELTLDGAGNDYTVVRSLWLASDSTELGLTPFVFEKKYILRIDLRALHNSTFPVGGVALDFTDVVPTDHSVIVSSETEASIYLTMIADAERNITSASVSLLGIEEGKLASSVNIVKDLDHYSVSLRWTSPSGTVIMLSPSVEYTVFVTLTPESGYYLIGGADFPLSVNGLRAPFYSEGADGSLTFAYTLVCPKTQFVIINNPISIVSAYRTSADVEFAFNKVPDTATLEMMSENEWIALIPAGEESVTIPFLEEFAGSTQTFRIRAVSADGDVAYSHDFTVTWDPAPVPLAFVTQPQGGIAGNGEAYSLSFSLTTTADSMRLERRREDGSWMTVKELSSTYADIDFADDYFSTAITFRVCASTLRGEFIYSDEFEIRWHFVPAFTLQPKGCSIRSGEFHSVTWATNATTDRCFLQTFESGAWIDGEDVSAPLEFTGRDSSTTYRLVAVIDEMEIYSDTFTVSFYAPAFSTQPKSGSVKNGAGYRVTWKTNFASRTGFRLQYKSSSGSWIDSVLVEASPYTVPFSPAFADKSVAFRFIGDVGMDTEFYSDEFVVTWSAAGFTANPSSGSILNGSDYTIVWDTSDTPKSITLQSYTDESGWVTAARSLSGKTYTISGENVSNVTKWYRLSAVIDGTTYYSNEFSVKWSLNGSPEFILQPKSGAVLNGKTYTVTWTCNATMTSYVIFHYEDNNGVGIWNYWGGSGTNSFEIHPTKMMSDTVERFRIKAYYSGGSTLSSEFVVKWNASKYTMLGDIAATGCAEPVEGRSPVVDPSLIFCSNHYHVSEIAWFNETGRIKYGPNYQFVNGTKYTVRVSFLPDDGYEFIPADLMTASLNGKTVATVETSPEDSRVRILTMSYTATPAPVYTRQPASATLNNGTKATVRFTFNLTPVSVTLQLFDSNAWIDCYEVSSPLSFEPQFNHTYSYRIKAVFDDGSVLYSDEFTLQWTDGLGTKLDEEYYIIGVTEPAAGAYPTTENIRLISYGCSINEYNTYWETLGAGNRWLRMSATDTFSVYGGARYRLHLVLTPNTGCYFGTTVKVIVNGQPVTGAVRYGANGTEIMLPIEYTVSSTGGKLTTAYITGLPDIGPDVYIDEVTGAEDYLGINNGWQIVAITVTNLTDGNTASGMFEYDHTYEIRFFIVPRSGYSFADASIRASVNTNLVSVTETVYENMRALRLSLIVTSTESGPVVNVTKADVKVRTPVEGGHPEFVIASAEPEKYSVEVISWNDLTTYATMVDSDAFVAGNGYQIRLRFTALNGYTFASDTVYMINGVEGELIDYFDPAARGMTFIANTKDVPVETETIPVTEPETEPPAMLLFTVQPQSVELVNGLNYTFDWDLSFTPTKTPILERYDASSDTWSSVAAVYEKTWELTFREFYRDTVSRYRIRAEYNGTVIYSSVFTVRYSVPRFSINPTGGIVRNGEDFEISFQTNVPVTLVRTERALGKDGEFSIGRDVISTSPYAISCGVGTIEDYSDSTVRFRLYAECEDGFFYSEVFTVTWTSGDTIPFFTRTPISDFRKPGESFKANWALSIPANTVTVEGDLDGDGVFETVYSDFTGSSCIIPYDSKLAGTSVRYRVCADYGSATIYSSEFTVKWEAPETLPPETAKPAEPSTDVTDPGKGHSSILWIIFLGVGVAISLTAATVLMYLVSKRRGVRK